MNTLHFPAKKKESRDYSRNSLVTMLCQEHLFCLLFYYNPPQKTSVLRASSPKSGAFQQARSLHSKDIAQGKLERFLWAVAMCDHGPHQVESVNFQKQSFNKEINHEGHGFHAHPAGHSRFTTRKLAGRISQQFLNLTQMPGIVHRSLEGLPPSKNHQNMKRR